LSDRGEIQIDVDDPKRAAARDQEALRRGIRQHTDGSTIGQMSKKTEHANEEQQESATGREAPE
jgi:hypothetical protein